MTMRKRWLAAGLALAVLGLACGSLGIIHLARTVPGGARPLGDALAGPTQTPGGRPEIKSVLPTATPTATTIELATESPSPPPATETTTVVLPTDTPEPVAGLTLTPTWTAPPTSVPPTATPRAPTGVEWIAFESRRGENDDYEIMVMAPDGSRQTNLSNSWADDVAPAWSPDGRRIAFVSFRDTATGKWETDSGSIYVMAFDPASGQSGEVRRITDDVGSDGWPTWSPDRLRIAFHSDRSGNWDIWIANADGSGLRQLTHHPGPDRFAAWSPDGTQIAFTSRRSGNDDVWVIDVAEALESGDDSGAINLTRSSGVDRYPFWSPDGQQLTFNTRRDGNDEVYIMNRDGSAPRNVSKSPRSSEGLADWSPDGRQLVFYSDRSGNKEIYILDLASRTWTNISNHPAHDEFCTWSPY